MLYVCGNEPENPRSQELLYAYEEHLPDLMDDEQFNYYLKAYDVTFDELTEMVYSLLEDKSNYGDPDRESIDDDLNTTIPVRGDGWTGITPLSLPQGGATGWYTLQGIKIAKPVGKGIYIHKDESGTRLIHNK